MIIPLQSTNNFPTNFEHIFQGFLELLPELESECVCIFMFPSLTLNIPKLGDFLHQFPLSVSNRLIT